MDYNKNKIKIEIKEIKKMKFYSYENKNNVIKVFDNGGN